MTRAHPTRIPVPRRTKTAPKTGYTDWLGRPITKAQHAAQNKPKKKAVKK